MKIKPKKCRLCKAEFMPLFSTTQVACSPKCAAGLAKQQQQEKEAKAQKLFREALKEKTKTKSEYEAELQKDINTIVRLIDAEHNCISSGRYMYPHEVNAGHFASVGSNPSIRFNLFNIYAQSIADNQHKGGCPIEFMEGLEKVFGSLHKELVLSLKHKYPSIKLSIEELKEARIKAKSAIKWLKLQDRTFTKTERLDLRQRFNDELGIYN